MNDNKSINNSKSTNDGHELNDKTGPSFIRPPSALLIVCAAGYLTLACGGSSARPDKTEEPNRTGGRLESVRPQYLDRSPLLSSDGSKMVFISGQESSDAAIALHAFKAEWAVGAEPGSPSRLTDTDLGLSRTLAIAPDGGRVLVHSVQEGAHKLSLVTFADGTVTAIPVTPLAVRSLAFSPDGLIVSWVARDASGNDRAYAMEVSDAPAADDIVELGLSTERIETLTWATGSYQVVTTVLDSESGQKTVYSLSFSDLATAQGSDRVQVMAGLNAAKVQPAAAGGMLLAATYPAQPTFSVRSGNFEEDDPEKTVVVTEATLLDLSASSTAKLSTVPGTKVSDLALASDGVTGFWLVSDVFKCSDGDLKFGTAIIKSAIAADTVERVLPVTSDSASSWALATNYCGDDEDADEETDDTGDDEDADEETAVTVTIDGKITEFDLNRAATATAYRVAYVSRFSSFWDEDCYFKTADPEVMLLDVNGDSASFYPLTNNRDPSLADERTDCP